MDIGKKIMDLRKKIGLSQEELAEKVGVARQTISKWELGETAPDIKQSKKLSEIFNISLDELTDNDIKDVLVEKTSNTEKLAGIILKLIKVIVILIVVFPIIYIIAFVLLKNYRKHSQGNLIDQTINCEINGESYSYSFIYYETTGTLEVVTVGDPLDYIEEEAGLIKYDDAYSMMNAIERFAKKNNGTCTRTEPKLAEEPY